LEEHSTNDYKLEHMGKERLLREYGRLPDSILLSEAAIELYEMFNQEEQHDDRDGNGKNGDERAYQQMIIPQETV